MPKANTFNLLFYGFTQNQSEKFDSSLEEKSFHITTGTPKKNTTTTLIEEERFIPKNLLEIQGTKEFNQLYSDLIRFYRERKECLPYEKIDSYKLSNNLVLSSIHLTSRGFLNSTNDSIYHFRQSFNLAVYLFESLTFKVMIMRTGPQTMLQNLMLHLTDHFNCQVIYGEPIVYRAQRWMLNKNKRSSISSGLRSNLKKDQIDQILQNIFSNQDLSPDRSNIISLGFEESSFRTLINLLSNFLLNFLSIIRKLFSYSYYYVRDYFNHSKRFFAYGKNYPSRIYWRSHIKDLLKASYLHLFYSYTSFFDWRTLKEQDKYVVLLASYQPEKSSNPDSLTFFDLRNLAESVKTRTNKNVKIVFKEHPSTLFRRMKEPAPRLGTLYRSINFYKELRDLGLILVPIEIDTNEIILNSEGVYCLTSTAILNLNVESKNNEIPLSQSINIFGDRWYGQLRNVITVEDDGKTNDRGELTLKDLITEQLTNGFYTLDRSGSYSEKVVDLLVPEIRKLLKGLNSN